MRDFFGFLTAGLYVGLAAFLAWLVFLAYASKQARDNPLRIVVGALATRIVASIGLAMLDIPLTAVEPIGGVVDVASLGFLAYYWWTGFRQMLQAYNPVELPSASGIPPTPLLKAKVRP